MRSLPASTRLATLPFQLSTDHQVIGSGSITTTAERRQGLLRLERDTLVVQWRVEREVNLIGAELRTDVEREGMREVTIPVRMLGDARVRTRGRWWWRHIELVVTARDLAAFDRIAGGDGISLAHPAELVLPVRPADIDLAHEFASEVELAIAELALAEAERASALPEAERGLALPEVDRMPTIPAPDAKSARRT